MQMANHRHDRCGLNERHYRKVNVFNGMGWKDFSLQFKAATRSSHEAAFEVSCWAELEQNDIDPQDCTELDVDATKQASGELFNILTTSLARGPLQTLYNCNFNGLEVWRRLSKRYSPTTPLMAMQLLLQIHSPEKTKDLKHVQSHRDKWVLKMLTLGRDLDKKLSGKLKATILISTLPVADTRNFAESGQVRRTDLGTRHRYGGSEALSQSSG